MQEQHNDKRDPEQAVELEGEGFSQQAEGECLHGAELGDPEAGHDQDQGQGQEHPGNQQPVLRFHGGSPAPEAGV